MHACAVVMAERSESLSCCGNVCQFESRRGILLELPLLNYSLCVLIYLFKCLAWNLRVEFDSSRILSCLFVWHWRLGCTSLSSLKHGCSFLKLIRHLKSKLNVAGMVQWLECETLTLELPCSWTFCPCLCEWRC